MDKNNTKNLVKLKKLADKLDKYSMMYFIAISVVALVFIFLSEFISRVFWFVAIIFFVLSILVYVIILLVLNGKIKKLNRKD